jgi:hypothetical protein
VNVTAVELRPTISGGVVVVVARAVVVGAIVDSAISGTVGVVSGDVVEISGASTTVVDVTGAVVGGNVVSGTVVVASAMVAGGGAEEDGSVELAGGSTSPEAWAMTGTANPTESNTPRAAIVRARPRDMI